MPDTHNAAMVIRRCIKVGYSQEYCLLPLIMTCAVLIFLLSLIPHQSTSKGQITTLPTNGSEINLTSPESQFDEDSVSQKFTSAHFTQLTNSPGNQVKLTLNYSVNHPSVVGTPINAIMQVTSTTNTSLVRTSSFPTPIVANQSGTIQLATTFTDGNLTDVVAEAKFTDADKTIQISNAVEIRLKLGEVLRPSPANV